MHDLREMPGMGHARPDLVDEPDVLFWHASSYLIVYRVEGPSLHVLRILHGRRDARTELGSG